MLHWKISRIALGSLFDTRCVVEANGSAVYRTASPANSMDEHSTRMWDVRTIQRRRSHDDTVAHFLIPLYLYVQSALGGPIGVCSDVSK